jgi:Protein of unknown function (DUF3226)
MPKRDSFEHCRAILSEGEEDAAVARAMLASHADSLPSFDVSPVVDIGGAGGHSGFEHAIAKADILSGFPAVTDVVLIADNDDDPAVSFNRVIAQIQAAQAAGLSRNWAIPAAPGVKAVGDVSVSIWLWPSHSQIVCLETLLWQLVRSEAKYKSVVSCVDQATQCAGINGWPLSKLDKARIRCFIALQHRPAPAVSLSKVWAYYPDLIRIRSAAFTPFLPFLRSI